jgi:hypothetical protein
MSENIDPAVQSLNEALPEILKLENHKKPDKLTTTNNNIFDLINHLNENGQQQQNQNSTSVLSSTPTDSQSQIDSEPLANPEQMDLILNSIEPIASSENNADLETSQSSENTSSASIEAESMSGKNNNNSQISRIPRTRIPVGLPRSRVSSSSINQNNDKSSIPTPNLTKIPRISVSIQQKKPENTPLPPPSDQVSQKPQVNRQPPASKKPNTLNIEPKILPKSSTKTSPRSFSRDVSSVSVSQTATTVQNSQKTAPKRGTSLTASTSISSLNTSFNGEDVKNKKTVRYAVRHKPRPSKVKIFSQKVEIKNATSKIGSLNNYDYKPSGGDVVIETKQLNWNAQSKINSLEFAAKYVPNGGNVKIESHKLNWKADAKIGSLEKAATYKPHGGNVKVSPVQ